MHLNDLKVRGLHFEESGQRDYPDDAVRGLAVRGGKRSKTFMLVTGTGSGRKRHTLGQYDPPHLTLAMVREKARDIIAANRLSKNEAPRTTFSEALETFYRTHIPEIRPRTAQLMRSSID